MDKKQLLRFRDKRQSGTVFAAGTKWALIGALLAIGIMAFFVTSLIVPTPDCELSQFALDEVTYQRGHTSQRVITSLFDVVQNTYYLYLDWTGRYTTTFFLYLFAIVPEVVFSFANAAFFVAAAWMMVLLARACQGRACAGKSSALQDSVIFSISAMLLWLIPDPGQIIAWKTGAIVYLHPIVYSLPLLLAHIRAFDAHGAQPKRGVGFAVGLFFYGVFVGATIEHLSLTLLFGCGLLFAVRVATRFTTLRAAVLSWEGASIAGLVIGSVIMLLAPGNSKRQEVVFFDPIAKLSLLDTREISTHFTRIYSTGYFFFLLVALGTLVTIALLMDKHGKRCKQCVAWSGFFALLANVSLLALYFSPYLADRTYSIAYFFYMAAVAVLAHFILEQAAFPLLQWGTLCLALCVALLAVVTPARQLIGFRNVVRSNDAIIAAAKADGENVMVVSVRDEDTPFNPYARYLFDSFEVGANRSYATLNEIDLIVSGTDTDTFQFDATTAQNVLPAPHTFVQGVVLNGVYTRQNAESLFVLLTFDKALDTQLLYQNRKRGNALVITAEFEADAGAHTVQQVVYPGYRMQHGSQVVYTNLLVPGKAQVNRVTVQLMNPETMEYYESQANVGISKKGFQ